MLRGYYGPWGMPQGKSDPRTMGFFSHIDELRARLMRCLWVFTGGFALSFFGLNARVMEVLRRPLYQALEESQRHLYFTSLFENFFTHLKVGAVTGGFLVSPYVFFQIWGFLSPGLLPRERKMVIPFVGAASVCFVGGAVFAYEVLFPIAFKYFVHFGIEGDVPLLTIEAYYSTVLKLLLLFGLAFELPVLICLLGFLGVVSPEQLRTNRRSAILGITIACALFAPPDALSMLILMAPLLLLYELSILVVSRFRSPR